MRGRTQFSNPLRGKMVMTRVLAIRGILLFGLLGFAYAVGSANLAAAQAPRKDEPKKDQPKKDEPNDQLFPQLPKIDLPPDDHELQKLEEELQGMREQILRQLGQMRGFQPGAFRNLPGVQLDPRFTGVDRRPKENRLGAVLQQPTPALVDQLDLPRDQGIVIERLNEDSAAGKAGLKANDILLELDDKAVPSNEADFVNMLNHIKPQQPLNTSA